jgi:hypothetical protein
MNFRHCATENTYAAEMLFQSTNEPSMLAFCVAFAGNRSRLSSKFQPPEMSNFDTNPPSENDWDERGDLAWNEFDWEHYLREQDDVLHRYLAFYEQLRDNPDRIDEVAHFMRWDEGFWSTDASAPESVDGDKNPGAEDEMSFRAEPYTLHKSPVFIATKAIYLSVKRAWERIAVDASKVPQALAVNFQASLHRGEENAILAVQALDFGDYAMAISLLKRALGELNQTLSLLDQNGVEHSRAFSHFRSDTLPRLFDLREIWLRVMHECRQELQRPADNDESEE